MLLAVKTLAFSIITLTTLGTASAGQHDDHQGSQEHRHHSAHVHGISKIDLVLEDEKLHLVLQGPAANLVGFEHSPSTPEQHATLKQTVSTLKDGDSLVSFNNAADCHMEHVHISSALIRENEEDNHENEHEHEHEHDKEHEESHSDMEVEYHFTCAHGEKLNRLETKLFQAFPALERLDVQFVINMKQGAATLTAAEPLLKF
jgi:hypothetical protein